MWLFECTGVCVCECVGWGGVGGFGYVGVAPANLLLVKKEQLYRGLCSTLIYAGVFDT